MNIWDVLRNLTQIGKPFTAEEFPVDAYNSKYMTMVLSQEPSFVPFLLQLNSYPCFSARARYMHYRAVYELLPKYPKSKYIPPVKIDDKYDKGLVEAFMSVYDVNDKVAKEYIDLTSSELHQLVLDEFTSLK